MRRLPVYVMVDVSETMAGPALEALQGGLSTMMAALRRDPMVIETGAVSIIAFGADAEVLVPLSDVTSVQIPELHISSGTSLGKAFRKLLRQMDAEVQKTTPEHRGDYSPIVFLITDGMPTDAWEGAYAAFRKVHPHVVIHAVGCGDDIDFSVLGKVTENVYVMKDMDIDAFGELFKCVSASIGRSVGASVEGVSTRFELVEFAGDLIRRPVHDEFIPQVRQRQAMIPVSCSKYKKPYLLRYRLNESTDTYDCIAAHKINAPLSGEGAKDTQIEASSLNGQVPCPYCGNEALVHCGVCGAASCLPSGAEHMVCPICGNSGVVTYSADFTFDRSRG